MDLVSEFGFVVEVYEYHSGLWLELPGCVAQKGSIDKAVGCAVCFLGHLYLYSLVWLLIVVCYHCLAEVNSKVGQHDESLVVASVTDYFTLHIVMECRN